MLFASTPSRHPSPPPGARCARDLPIPRQTVSVAAAEMPHPFGVLDTTPHRASKRARDPASCRVGAYGTPPSPRRPTYTHLTPLRRARALRVQSDALPVRKCLGLCNSGTHPKLHFAHFPIYITTTVVGLAGPLAAPEIVTPLRHARRQTTVPTRRRTGSRAQICTMTSAQRYAFCYKYFSKGFDDWSKCFKNI